MSPKAQKLLDKVRATAKQRLLETQIVAGGHDAALNELLRLNLVDIIPDPDSKKPPGRAPGMVILKGKSMSTTDEQRPAFDNDGPPYTLDGMDPLLRGLIVNAVHGAMATKAPPPANHWLTASWEIGRAMTNAVGEPAAPVDARDERPSFEQWAIRTHGKFTLSDPDIGAMWSAWKARAAIARQAAAPAERVK